MVDGGLSHLIRRQVGMSNPPHYREGRCCMTCVYYGGLDDYCNKHEKRVLEWMICDDYVEDD